MVRECFSYKFNFDCNLAIDIDHGIITHDSHYDIIFKCGSCRAIHANADNRWRTRHNTIYDFRHCIGKVRR